MNATATEPVPNTEQKNLYADWFAKAVVLAGGGLDGLYKLSKFSLSRVRVTEEPEILMSAGTFFTVNFDRIAAENHDLASCAQMILNQLPAHTTATQR